MEASITFKSVAKQFEDESSIAELTFGVEKNTIMALIGPNNSGKSSILKMICGLIYKDKGSIYIKGYDTNVKMNHIKSLIGYMPQKIDFDKNLTIFENIYLYARLHGLSKNNSINKVDQLLNKLNIFKYSNKKIANLPYGIIRVAMFARTIIHNPEIIILDEPTSNLDPIYKEIIWKHLISINKNKTVFYATHNFKEAQNYSDRIALLFNGTIKYNGTFEKLVKNTFGLTRFIIIYKESVPEEISKQVTINPNIVRPVIVDNQLKFYSTNKREYLNLLKKSLQFDIIDTDSSKCTLEDIFKGIDSGESI
tara:strand:- start:531 stop:1457 length:927 start_codon:yes stop_codon:yes gene_type:complete